MGDAKGTYQLALLVQHSDIVVVIRPIDASKKHDYLLQGGSSPGSW
jgi:hypothetical protein